MTKGKNKRKAQQNVFGVYNVITFDNKNIIKIKQLGVLENGSSQKPKDSIIKDKQVELVQDKLLGYFFTCNITSNFLVRTKKLPVLYMFVEYNHNNIMKAGLFKLFLFFTIEEEVKSEAQLLHNELKGKFTLELEIDNVLEEISVLEFTSIDNILDDMNSFVKSENMTEIINDMVETTDKERETKYGDMFADCEIPTVTLSLKDIANSST